MDGWMDGWRRMDGWILQPFHIKQMGDNTSLCTIESCVQLERISLLLCCCFTSMVNICGHDGMVS